MKLFMEPRSIAIVGATRKTGQGSFNIIEQLNNLGFEGKIFPINPEADYIMGMKAYPCIGDVTEKVDLALIPVWERTVALKIVQECIAAGIKAIIVVGQGFADGDREGKELQDKLVTTVKAGGARLVGPNSLGVINAFMGLNTAFIPRHTPMEKLPIGVICQSGFFFYHLLGKAIDIANSSDINFTDVLEYFENDPETKVILLHIEGLRDGRRFLETAKRVSAKKPIIALKTARSEKGAKAAQSHTGSLAGRPEVSQAALKQCGIVPASDITELEELAKAFFHLPLMQGRRIGILSVSGGIAVMSTDACIENGLEIAELSPNTLTKLQPLSPPWMKVNNPLDLWPPSFHSGLGLGEVVKQALEAFVNDPGVDGVFLFPGIVLTPEEMQQILLLRAELKKELNKPVCWWVSDAIERRVELEKQGEVVFSSLERAFRALGRLNDYWQFRQTLCEGLFIP